jgi:AcrR family transcriptional regulator
MARSPRSRKTSRRRYHHGDLRPALLEAGLQILRESGTEAITFREVARRAEVSHMAHYHHFRDKAALIEALAVETFGRFTQTLRSAWEGGPRAPMERLQALGVAYVRFALEHPAEFRLMHVPGLRHKTHREERAPVGRAAREAYEVLQDAVRACQDAGLIPAGDPESLALAAWSTVHGLAVLLLDGLLDGNQRSIERGVALAQVVTRVLGQGLAVR